MRTQGIRVELRRKRSSRILRGVWVDRDVYERARERGRIRGIGGFGAIVRELLEEADFKQLEVLDQAMRTAQLHLEELETLRRMTAAEILERRARDEQLARESQQELAAEIRKNLSWRNENARRQWLNGPAGSVWLGRWGLTLERALELAAEARQ